MGLDMYLYGQKFLTESIMEPESCRKEDGKAIAYITVNLGYWRKHPNLHGFIVNEFAGGKDECQRIDLSMEALRKIVGATMNKSLPHTTGFFFGESTADDDQQTIAIIMQAIAWLDAKVDGEMRSVYYEASW